MPNKVYFVVSDVHSFYKPMMSALDEAGYDPSNADHVLIVCGDVFDRGPDSKKMLEFLRSVPRENRVYIRGNHEYLLKECFERGFFRDYDTSNGTLRTMCNLVGINPDFYRDLARKAYEGLISFEEYSQKCDSMWKSIDEKPFRSRKIKNLVDWIFSDDWVDYYRLDRYVFVHAWIPVLRSTDELSGERVYSFDKDWETRSRDDWEFAVWLCPWKAYQYNLGPADGDTLVCGHWHVQDFHTHLGHDEDGYKNREIYYSDRLIALDAMTALEPHVCNVLVIRDGKCYDKHGNVLKDAKEEK